MYMINLEQIVGDLKIKKCTENHWEVSKGPKKKKNLKELIKSEEFWLTEEMMIVTDDNSFNKTENWQYLLLKIHNE